jgi:hypothetical protein
MNEVKVVIILVMVLLAGAGCLSPSAREGTSSPRSSPSITILEHSGEIDTGSGTYVVHGTAKNTGTAPLVKVYIVVTTYDDKDVKIGSTYTALLDIKPGDEAPFRIEARPYFQGIRVARYDINPDYNFVP